MEVRPHDTKARSEVTQWSVKHLIPLEVEVRPLGHQGQVRGHPVVREVSDTTAVSLVQLDRVVGCILHHCSKSGSAG